MPLNNFVRLSCLGLTVYKLMRCLKAMPHDFLIALAFQRGVRLTFVCRLSALWLTDSFHAEAPLDGELKEGGGVGMMVGVGDTQQSFIRGVPPPGPTPYHFIYYFWQKRYPFRIRSKWPPPTATYPFFGGQSVHRRFFKPFSNCHLSTTTTFFCLKLAVMESWDSTVSSIDEWFPFHISTK